MTLMISLKDHKTDIRIRLTLDECRYICEWLMEQHRDAGARDLHRKISDAVVDEQGIGWILR